MASTERKMSVLVDKLEIFLTIVNKQYDYYNKNFERTILNRQQYYVSVNLLDKYKETIIGLIFDIKDYIENGEKEEEIQNMKLDTFLDEVQKLSTNLSKLAKQYGIKSLEDFLIITKGYKYINDAKTNHSFSNTIVDDNSYPLYLLLNEYAEIVSYTVLNHNIIKNTMSNNQKEKFQIKTPKTPKMPKTPNANITTSTNPFSDKNMKVDLMGITDNNTDTNTINNNESSLEKSVGITDERLCYRSSEYMCYELRLINPNIYLRRNMLRFVIHDKSGKRTYVVKCYIRNCYINSLIVDEENDMIMRFIDMRMNEYRQLSEEFPMCDNEEFHLFLDTLRLQDILLYDKMDLYYVFKGKYNKNKMMRKKEIRTLCNEFLSCRLSEQYNMLYCLMLSQYDDNMIVIVKILFNLLDNNETQSKAEQNIIFSLLPNEMKHNIYNLNVEDIFTQEKTQDEVTIPYNQRIMMMNAPEIVKNKAFAKLGQMKNRHDDVGNGKIQEYLDGLLSIPFGRYKSEPILNYIKEINTMLKVFMNMKGMKDVDKTNKLRQQDGKHSVVNYTIMKNFERMYIKYLKGLCKQNMEHLKSMMREMNYKNISDFKKTKTIKTLYDIISFKTEIKYPITNSNKSELYTKLDTLLDLVVEYCCELLRCRKIVKFNDMVLLIEEMKHFIYQRLNILYLNEKEMTKFMKNKKEIESYISFTKQMNMFNEIKGKWDNFQKDMKMVQKTLHNSVHGHYEAKRNIERVLGQWITGKQQGYCFGFEGAPGLGKTTIAKYGISQCLRDEDGNPRPFAFISIGGKNSSSILNGHSYTYVGATWGRIVDILMECKHMNPIIMIDELDKVSGTEQGREIIGILTHLVDSTQNDCFHDKYFNGIDIDLSKALFIFSYNDASLIDSILLDRIHRVKFNHLSKSDKLVICEKYLLPELERNYNLKICVVDTKKSYKKKGTNIITIPKSVLSHIIEYYTHEAGVRRLKQLLNEIIGEVNLSLLMRESSHSILITEDDVDNKYLKTQIKKHEPPIRDVDYVGTIHGLWANSYGQGGTLDIETTFMESSKEEFILTGKQGEVMKESMHVAKTLARGLYSEYYVKKTNTVVDEKMFKKSIHIHCPEGATPKDGPSAGTAITVCLFSLFSNLKIPHNIAITGEITLRGNVTKIGGLDLKLLGGIRNGIKHFIIPDDNIPELNKFMDTLREKGEMNIIEDNDIKITPVKTIEEVLEIIFNI